MPVSIPSDHPSHDLTLIAGHAAGELSTLEQIRAEKLITTCGACADLRRDLVTIVAATRALPAPAGPTRDFRLTADQAAHLRRGSWIRRILEPFGPTRSAVRPLAAAFTSLGLAGIFVFTVLPGFLGSAASMAAPSQERDYVTAAGTTAPAAPGALGAGSPSGAPAQHVPGGPMPDASDTDTLVKGASGGSAAPEAQSGGLYGGVATEQPAARPAELARERGPLAGLNPLVLGSIGLVLAGLALFGLRLAARRVV